MVNVDQSMILFHMQSPQHSSGRSKTEDIVEEAGFIQVCIESFFQYRCIAFKINENNNSSLKDFKESFLFSFSGFK